MLNKDSFLRSASPSTRITPKGVVVESTVTLACDYMLSHEQYATAHDQVIADAKDGTAKDLWRLIYGDLACALEQIAASSEDHNTADNLRTIVARLAP